MDYHLLYKWTVHILWYTISHIYIYLKTYQVSSYESRGQQQLLVQDKIIQMYKEQLAMANFTPLKHMGTLFP